MAPSGTLKGKKALLCGALSKEMVGKKEGHVCFMSPISPWQTMRFMGSGVMLLFCIISIQNTSLHHLVPWMGWFIFYNKRRRREQKSTFLLIHSPVSPKECKVQGTVLQCGWIQPQILRKVLYIKIIYFFNGSAESNNRFTLQKTPIFSMFM